MHIVTVPACSSPLQPSAGTRYSMYVHTYIPQRNRALWVLPPIMGV